MRTTDGHLPIRCPKCRHDRSTLLIKSYTVMTLVCDSCGHLWASDLMALPAEIEKKIPEALQDVRVRRYRSH